MNPVTAMVSSLLAAFGLNPVVAGTPQAPTPAPISPLWMALAWVHREMQQAFSNQASTLAYNPKQNTQVDNVVTGTASSTITANSAVYSTAAAVNPDAPVVGTPTVYTPDPVTGYVYGRLGFTDPNNKTLTYTVTGAPANGTVSVWSNAYGGGFGYTPTAAARLAAAAPGAPVSATQDKFTVTASNGTYSTAVTVTVPISPLATAPPVAGTPTVYTPDPVTGYVYGRLGFTDPNNKTLTYTVTGAPAKGTVSVWSNAYGGGFGYTPTVAARQAAAAPGAPASATQDKFTVSVSNGTYSTTETVTVPVSPIAPPVAGTPAVGSTNQVTGAVTGTLGFTDPYKYTLTYTLTGAPANGSVSVWSNAYGGGYTYTPTAAARLAAGDAPGAPLSATLDKFTVSASNGVYSTAVTVNVPISPILTTDNSVTAAGKYGWGTPNRATDFTSSSSLSGWYVYNAAMSGGWNRTPNAISFANNTMIITGDAQGNTGGLASWPGQQYGAWEVRVKVDPGAPGYRPVLLLWPDAENWPTGGEIDFMEGSNDGTRQTLSGALHYSSQNLWDPAYLNTDATQWHNYGVSWTPTTITYYVDGVPWKRYINTSQFPPGPMHLAIQLDVHTADVSQGGKMYVAWARQYSYVPNMA
jgi:hypothetical protein